MAESLTLPQRSEYWPLDERDTVLGFPLTFISQHRAKADISMLVKADIFILGRQIGNYFLTTTSLQDYDVPILTQPVERRVSLTEEIAGQWVRIIE